MYQHLKGEIEEIIGIVKQCPETFQEKCFEILLNNLLDSNCQKNEAPEERSRGGKHPEVAEPIADTDSEANTNGNRPEKFDEEIFDRDIHAKIRKFLGNNNITYEMINDLYYKDGDSILPLYESLNSNQMSECQIRIALLSAFENSFSSGDMQFNGEAVRDRCQKMKCYDGPHFANAFSRFSSLFDNWDKKYDKLENYSLSAEGKKKLAEVLKDLSQVE